MKSARILPFLLLTIICCICSAYGTQIDTVPWTDANIGKLDHSTKTAIAQFVNGLGDPNMEVVLDPYRIGGFEWRDLAGNGDSELIVGTYWPATSWTTIYWRESSGKFNAQALRGETSFKNGIRDLDGDGKKEIIIYSYIDLAGRRGANPTPVWPQVYRLEGEKYVPASKDFIEFYKLEVLPKLDREIGKTPYPGDRVEAALEMQRDKIRRVLGLDRNAGLERAQNWAKSDDPELIEDAIDVFHDIPDHEAEAKAAEQAWKEALQRQRANPSK